MSIINRGELNLKVYAKTPFGEFGILFYDDQDTSKYLHTIERPYLNNRQNVSSIPLGQYRVYRRTSPKLSRITRDKYTDSVSVTVFGRSYIMFHNGNTVDDTEGCIILGTSLGYIANKWAVVNSMDALDIFQEFMDNNPDVVILNKTFDADVCAKAGIKLF
jgi:hypothetical protein